MPWLEPEDCPDYNFLKTGRLQYRDRFGQFRVCGGCNGDNWWEFQELREEAVAVLAASPEQVTAEECYLSDARFQWLCNSCLEHSGINPEHIGIRQVLRLLFAREEDGQIIDSPLALLNQMPGARHPRTAGAGSGVALSDKASLLAALVSHCASLAEVDQLMDQPVVELLKLTDDLAWMGLAPKDRDKATMLADAKNSSRRIDSVAAQAMQQAARSAREAASTEAVKVQKEAEAGAVAQAGAELVEALAEQAGAGVAEALAEALAEQAGAGAGVAGAGVAGAGVEDSDG
jgi:hypothetical protein